MFENLNRKLKNTSHRGGIVGALVGAVLSVGIHRAGDKPLKVAGKTALFSGAGFILGDMIEKFLKKKMSLPGAAFSSLGLFE